MVRAGSLTSSGDVTLEQDGPLKPMSQFDLRNLAIYRALGKVRTQLSGPLPPVLPSDSLLVLSTAKLSGPHRLYALPR